jgi:O-acetyl-ADP-ribose deacetylase (regulator of RNase III)
VITVVVDDLASMRVDAVLRPAGESLESLTAAAGRLDELGGQRFADQHRVSAPLEAGAAVVTGAGDLVAPFVIHVVIRDSDSPVARTTVRRALVSAWQRATEWGLARIATPLVGMEEGQLSLVESATLLVETFPRPGAADNPTELCIVVQRQEDRDAVEAIVRRTA